MKKTLWTLSITFCIAFSFYSCGNDNNQLPDEEEEENTDAPKPGPDFPTERNVYQWPFDKKSIWNMPIGSEATYVHAHLEPANAITIDEDYIVLMPDAPLMKVYSSDGLWSGDRCAYDPNKLLFEAPIPQSWVVSKDTWDGLTPNAGIAVLLKDGVTLIQSQPFAHCEEGAKGTSRYVFSQVNITGDGISGAHGGSGLSAIGGALRTHELTQTSGPIRHALKINLYGAKNLFYDWDTKGFRWPADRADAYASTNEGYGHLRTSEAVKECRMGALLALPASLKIENLGLKTEPARVLAQALQDYGAYVVDDTGWNVHAIITEWSPQGRFTDEFKKNWGFDFVNWNASNDWGKDINILFANLHVITNNTKSTIGGPGFRRQPYAPKFNK